MFIRSELYAIKVLYHLTYLTNPHPMRMPNGLCADKAISLVGSKREGRERQALAVAGYHSKSRCLY